MLPLGAGGCYGIGDRTHPRTRLSGYFLGSFSFLFSARWALTTRNIFKLMRHLTTSNPCVEVFSANAISFDWSWWFRHNTPPGYPPRIFSPSPKFQHPMWWVWSEHECEVTCTANRFFPLRLTEVLWTSMGNLMHRGSKDFFMMRISLSLSVLIEAASISTSFDFCIVLLCLRFLQIFQKCLASTLKIDAESDTLHVQWRGRCDKNRLPPDQMRQNSQ